MAARVLGYVLAEDSDRYTAAELAQGLRVSRAAISGAVRLLVQTGMLAKERDPGGRVDQYRVYDDDVWAAINQQRMPALQRWAEAIEEGIELVGRDTRGGRRLRQSQRASQTRRQVAPQQGRVDREPRPPVTDAAGGCCVPPG